MNRPALRVGARTSRLARRQASIVMDALAGGSTAEFVGLRTSGDLAPDVPINAIGGTGVFTREIERALLAGEIDVAVHSLKDLSTIMPEGLRLAACLPREDPRDALLLASSNGGPDASTGLAALPRGAIVGTASLRRRAFLLRARPDLRVGTIRGNVPTRLKKLREGAFDAVVLATAGLLRLGLEGSITAVLSAESFPPAPGQGAIAVQIRDDDARTSAVVDALDHEDTRVAVTAERAFLRRIEGGCQAPAGALATMGSDRRLLRLDTLVCSADGSRAVATSVTGDPRDAAGLGRAAAEQSLAGGADDILDELRRSTEQA